MDRGRVVRIEGNYAYIEMHVSSGCRNCANKSLCFSNQKPIPLKVENNFNLNINDLIEIEFDEKKKLLAGFLLFLLPLIIMIIGYAIAIYIFNKEIYGIIGAIIGVVVSFMIIKKFNNVVDKKDILKPLRVKKIIKE